MRVSGAAAILAAILAAGCAGEEPPAEGRGGPAPGPAAAAAPADRGRALFEERVGGLSCADCHSTAAEDQPDRDRIRVGHSLADATRRPSWWYGTIAGEKGVGDAVLTCVARFQQRSWNTVLPTLPDGGKDLSKVEVPAADRDALVAYLETLARPGPHPALAAKRDASRDALARVEALPGDAARGRKVYRMACAPCHGVRGEGDLGTKLNGDDAPDAFRVVDYARSGPTRSDRESVDAWMPFYTPDVLPDQDLADLAALIDGGEW